MRQPSDWLKVTSRLSTSDWLKVLLSLELCLTMGVAFAAETPAADPVMLTQPPVVESAEASADAAQKAEPGQSPINFSTVTDLSSAAEPTATPSPAQMPSQAPAEHATENNPTVKAVQEAGTPAGENTPTAAKPAGEGSAATAAETPDAGNAVKLPIKAYASVIADDYILGPNDVLSLQVFGFPELTHDELKVQPDGQLMLDLVGPIKVAGMTTTQVYQLIREKYSRVLKDPKITLNVSQTKPIIVYITGAVLNPGIYEVLTNTQNMTRFNNTNEVNIDRRTPILSSMLSASGGITYDADFEHIEINNKFTGEKRTVNLLSLVRDGMVDEDVYLHPGDVVHVPRISPLAQDPQKYKAIASASFAPKTVPVKVYGYVNTQGLVNLNPAQNLNLMSAITAAGGFYQSAAYAPTKVYIFRPDNAGKLAHVGVFNPTKDDPQLMPNDVVYVPDKLRPNIAKVFDYVNNVIRPFESAAITYRSISGKYLFNNNRPSNTTTFIRSGN